MRGHPDKFPTLPGAKSTVGPTRQAFRLGTQVNRIRKAISSANSATASVSAKPRMPRPKTWSRADGLRATLVTAVARNPSARDQVFGLGILGFALTEAVALFALLIAFLILFT